MMLKTVQMMETEQQIRSWVGQLLSDRIAEIARTGQLLDGQFVDRCTIEIEDYLRHQRRIGNIQSYETNTTGFDVSSMSGKRIWIKCWHFEAMPETLFTLPTDQISYIDLPFGLVTNHS